MSRFAAPIRLLALVVVAAVVAPSTASAASAQDFLNAPIWYVQYEVSFTSTYQGTYQSFGGAQSFTSSLERVFSASDVLNLRSQGPGSFSLSAMYGGGEGKTPTAAEAQAATMKMLSQMENTANWMAAGAAVDENATEADIAASLTPSSPVRIDYTRVDVGTDLFSEMGTKYDSKTTTTIKGTGVVLAGGMGSILLEIDSAANTYVLTLPFLFSAQGAAAKRETVNFVQSKGTPGEETHDVSDISFDHFPSELALDDPKQGYQAGGVTIRGTMDPSKGNISGEQSFRAHYSEGGDAAPGTLVFKYTLTMTPPPKK